MRSMATTLIAVSLAASLTAQSSARDLFERARMLEESNQHLTDAIELYRQVADRSTDRELAANAQVRVALVQERLGQKREAQESFRKVLDRFADQSTAVRLAQARLMAGFSAPVPVAKRVWGDGADLYGAPSPDGKLLSYVDWATGDLAVREVASGVSRRVTNYKAGGLGFVNESAFSPDGREIAYEWLNPVTNLFELWITRADGRGTPRALLRNEHMNVVNFAWGADGRTIAVCYGMGAHQLALVSVSDGVVRGLQTLDWRSPLHIALSPDGKYLLYDFPQDEASPQRDIRMVATDGSTASAFVEHAASDSHPVWTPDGKHVVFMSDRSGAQGMWIVSAAGGRPTGQPRLLQMTGNVAPLGFTTAGALFYGVKSGGRDVYVATLDIESGKLTSPPRAAAKRFVGTNERPHWSPDGRFLAFQSDRAQGQGPGARVLAIVDMQTDNQRDLRIDLQYFQRPRWSPDGRYLLVNGNPQRGRQGLFTIDAQTGQVSLALIGEGSSFGQAWGPDGRSVIYTGGPTSARAIVEQELESGRRRTLYRVPPGESAGDSSLSPDGEWVAFREGAGSATLLKVVSRSTGVSRELHRVIAPGSIAGFGGINWTPDSRYLLYVSGTDDERRVWKVAIAGGPPQRTELRGKQLRDVTLHPDGKTVAYTIGEGSDEVWILDHVLPVIAGAGSGRR